MTKPSLLMTRPVAQARAFVSRLDPELMQGVACIFSPLIEIVPTGTLPELAPGAAAIFTSAQAVPLAPDALHRDAFCVGARTAEAAGAAGWQVRLTAETAEDLIAQMEDISPRKLVHFAGQHRRGDIAARLTENGRPTEVVTLYDQQARDLTAEAKLLLTGNATVILPLFSPRTAAQFAAEVHSAPSAVAVALSDAVAASLGSTRLAEVLVARAPTTKDMVSRVEKALVDASLP